MKYRISVDTGGTFTDVVVQDDRGKVVIGKSLTTPDRIFHGMRGAMQMAAGELGVSVETLLGEAGLLIYGTTHSTNAIVQGKVAKTAFLTTRGFPDILVTREGGKFGPHDFSYDFPRPYIARRHTFEVDERISSEGEVVTGLDEAAARKLAKRLVSDGFEAAAVCFLWSIANPLHELRMGEILAEEAPGIAVSLSHVLVPIVREYRRASTTAIDASIKPLMQNHLREMQRDLVAAGFAGDILVSTSAGGCTHVADLVEKPVHTVKSGPAMAPVAGRAFSRMEDLGDDVIICDTGGTTFDVGLVREGELKYTRETWLGGQWMGHLTAISSVDVRSIGAGGGSIAWIDNGGLLRVGPMSAGSVPGPACYGKGGDKATVTDAALVLGYIDPAYFLGGRMKLDVDAAKKAVGTLATELGISLERAAFAIINIANEHMINAIQDITVAEGFDPCESTLVAGGGAAGINIVPIARELGVRTIILPKTASALSASGMQFSDIIFEESGNCVTTTGRFDYEGVRNTLDEIDTRLDKASEQLEIAAGGNIRREYTVEARYLTQVWELDAALPSRRIEGEQDVLGLVDAFHQSHERVFAVRDETAQVECLNWRGRMTVSLGKANWAGEKTAESGSGSSGTRRSYFGDSIDDVPVYRGQDLEIGCTITGPAIIEEPTTTVVVYPGSTARVSANSNYIISL
ncbi:hydantoinase/oxoprolinase family protein [Shinella daejeonensis]|uniref:hydantoinase/oxoprolinase family protein n=1 Tax=Shinella daejeonensis TaxID=659017 RepID=UPI0020C7F982|nr:hydantoinase/oxoprolinase family protein [Shinella daejeonensis]MCP8895269.1 hydantoinase/oxoprolinase family protein [Shinella daejeonensis]